MRVDFDRILYLFPHILIVSHPTVYDAQLAAEGLLFKAPAAVIKISWLESFREKKIFFHDVYLYRPVFDLQASGVFWSKNSERILTFLQNLPGQELNILIRKGHLPGQKMATPVSLVGLHGLVHVEKKRFRGQFFWSEKAGARPGMPDGKPSGRVDQTQCSFEALITDEGLVVEFLSLKNRQWDVRFWGEFVSDRLTFKGYALYGGLEQMSVPVLGKVRNPKGWFSRLRQNVTPAARQAQFYFLDIDGTAELKYPVVAISIDSMKLNNVPFSTKSEIDFSGGEVRLNSRIMLTSPVKLYTGIPQLQEGRVDLSAESRHGKWFSSGSIQGRFSLRGQSNFSINAVDLTFDELQFVRPLNNIFSFRLGSFLGRCWVNENPHQIQIADLTGRLIRQNGRYYVADFFGPFYQGRMDGRGWFNVLDPRLLTALKVDFIDVDTPQLAELLEHFAKFEGRLSANLFCNSSRPVPINGQLKITEGRIRQVMFFEWLAETFALPQLQALRFQEAAALFFVDDDKAGLTDILVKSPDCRIKGDFIVNSDNLVSSRLSLNLSRSLMQGSAKLAYLISDYDQEAARIPFEFQLSGHMGSLNFQWLPSALKDQIQEKIPDFIERKIERNIDSQMKSGIKSEE